MTERSAGSGACRPSYAPAMRPIVTERLLLRPLRREDLPAFAAYRSDPDIARYQSWDTPYTAVDAERILGGPVDGDAEPEPGAWRQVAAVDRVTGTLHGDCAVRLLADQPATAEVGVTFARAAQGRGLATEALGAAVSDLFEVQGLHRVFASADDRNRPVQRLLERLGFRREATFLEADWFKGEWTTLLVYAVLAREWREGRR